MQIHEITKNKISEGFMDAIKGIGGVAAQGLNKTLGTNIGGAGAGAAVAPGQMQKTALQINTQLAQQQAKKLANDYAQIAAQASTTGVNANALQDDLERIVYQQLMPGVRDIAQLPAMVDPSQKTAADQIVQQVKSAMTTLLNIRTASDPKLSEKTWTVLTTAAAQAQNLRRFKPVKAAVPALGTKPAAAPVAAPATADVGIGPQGDLLYRGRPYDPTDPVARNAVSQFLLAQKNLVANKP